MNTIKKQIQCEVTTETPTGGELVNIKKNSKNMSKYQRK